MVNIRSVKYKDLNFVAPATGMEMKYLKEYQSYHVTHLIRTCEKTYDPNFFESNKIKCHAMEFDDGKPPPDNVIKEFLELVKNREKNDVFGVHCTAGIGRAPTLVAVALISAGKMSPDSAVRLLSPEGDSRVMSDPQLQFLFQYKPDNGCIIM